MAANQLRALEQFSACDIADALVKLKVPRAGFIADLTPFAPHGPVSPQLASQAMTIGPASTVLLVPSSHPDDSGTGSNLPIESNIPADTHYVDLTKPGTIVCISQPKGQHCAVVGGNMALRMKTRGATGIVVGGRIRDLRELRVLDLPIWAAATSAVPTQAESKPWAIDIPIDVHGVEIKPGDIVFADPVEGVVLIPKDKLDEVIELVPQLAAADEKVTHDVRNGGSIFDAFKKHRG